MIAYRDFAPRITAHSRWFRDAQYETFDAAVAAANEWIAADGIKVISVETVVLPNIHSPDEEGTGDPAIRTPENADNQWHQFVRVWYEPA